MQRPAWQTLLRGEEEEKSRQQLTLPLHRDTETPGSHSAHAQGASEASAGGSRSAHAQGASEASTGELRGPRGARALGKGRVEPAVHQLMPRLS